MSRWKRSLKGVLRSLGLQLRWLPPRYACRQNMFTDQRAILGERGAGLILDVGANVGQSVMRYRWLFPDAVIHSFEPVPEVFEELRRSASGDTRVHVWQLAMSDVTGVVRFQSNRMSDTSSLLATQPDLVGHAYMGTKSVLEVPSETLDQFCAEQAIPSASILKLDVQGGEGRVLSGAKGLLERQAFDVILTEVWFDAPYVGAPHFCEIDAILRAAGYTLYGMYFGPHQYREYSRLHSRRYLRKRGNRRPARSPVPDRPARIGRRVCGAIWGLNGDIQPRHPPSCKNIPVSEAKKHTFPELPILRRSIDRLHNSNAPHIRARIARNAVLRSLPKRSATAPSPYRQARRPSRQVRRSSSGFRAWLSAPNPKRWEVCDCGWAPELGQHCRPNVDSERARQ